MYKLLVWFILRFFLPLEDTQSARVPRPLTVPTAVLGAPRDPLRRRQLRSAPGGGGRTRRSVPDTSKVTFHGSDPVKDAWLRASEGDGEFQGVVETKNLFFFRKKVMNLCMYVYIYMYMCGPSIW